MKIEASMKRKGKVWAVALALALSGACVLGWVWLETRARIAGIVSDEAEWDLRDAAVRPLPVQIDADSLSDGIYPVSIAPNGIAKADGGCLITFEIFNRDLYDAVELHLLEPGHYIEIAGRLLKINTLSKDGTVIINGGFADGGAADSGSADGGANLVSVGGGVYRCCLPDGRATYTSFGKTTLFVPETIDFAVYSLSCARFKDDDCLEPSVKDVLLIHGSQLYDYLSAPRPAPLDHHSLKIRIENGAVVEFWCDARCKD